MMALYLKIMMKMVIIMIIDDDDDDSLPLHGHGKECENGDADSEAGGEGVEAATMFSRSFLVKSLGTCCWACWSSRFRPVAFSQWLKQANNLTQAYTITWANSGIIEVSCCRIFGDI